MNTLDRLSERGTSLVGHARQTLESGASHLPKLLEAGAMLGVAKTGVRAATTLARRNPALAITLGVVGAGLLAYRFYRKRAQTHDVPAKLVVHRKPERSESVEDAQTTDTPKPRVRKTAKSNGSSRAKSGSPQA